MDIGQYISDLLKDHEEVSLPGIGTFFKRTVNAYFDANDCVYYPPSYKVDFKESEETSSLLINHVVNIKRISESSAIYFIERFAEKLRSNLEKDSTTPVLPLGTLSKDGSALILNSTPIDSAPDFFGLKPVKELNIRASSLIEKGADLFPNEVAKPNRTWVWILGLILLLSAIIGLAYFYYPLYFKNLTNNKPKNKVIVPVAVPDSVKSSVSFADSIVDQLEKQGLHGSEVEKAQDTFKISSKTTSPDSLKIKPVPPVVYEIIVGSFALASEAETSVKNLRNRGIDAKVVVDTRKPKFKVSLGSFVNSATANKEKQRIQQDINKEAWILTVTNKEKN